LPACCCFIPADTFKNTIWTDVAGLALGAILLAREFMAVRLQRQTA